MKYFILNHPPLIERKEVITGSLKRESVDYKIVDKFVPGTFDYESITNTNYNEHRDIPIHQLNGFSYLNNPNKVGQSSISLILKHMECWKEQIELGLDYVVILEDDCEIPFGFKDYIQSIESEFVKSDYDLVMVGTFIGFESPDISDNILKYHKDQKTRCTHCYIISIDAAKKMIDGFKNLNNSIDFKMNEVIQINNLKVAWVEPGLKQI